ncbi:MAG: LptF/LptG family permease [Aquificaceae bacterium]|nr:LptF/LptG family permease [Aquificaceae bacterium]
MLDRYILINHIKAFLLILTVIIGIIYAYLMGEVFLLFKDKSQDILISYTINFMLIAFFYMNAFVTGIALLVVFRRILAKKIDLLAQSFGISPLKLYSSVVLFSLFLFSLNLLCSYKLYPESQKNLYRIEREYKKAKEVESGLVRNLWLTNEENGEVRFYNFELVDISDGRLYRFYMLRVKEGSIKEVVTAEVGKWDGERIKLRDAKIKNLVTGEELTGDLDISYLELDRIKPLAEKPEHLPMKDVLMLSLLGDRTGLNHRYYSYEMARRFFSSTLSVFMTLILGWVYLRWRNFNIAIVSLLAVFSLHWFLLNLMRSLAEGTNLNLFFILMLYLPIPLLSLKGLYNLGKGFRL